MSLYVIFSDPFTSNEARRLATPRDIIKELIAMIRSEEFSPIEIWDTMSKEDKITLLVSMPEIFSTIKKYIKRESHIAITKEEGYITEEQHAKNLKRLSELEKIKPRDSSSEVSLQDQ